MKKKVFLLLVLGLLAGCAPGEYWVLRPEINISGSFAPTNSYGTLSTLFAFGTITLTNATRHWAMPMVNGRHIVEVVQPTGQKVALLGDADVAYRKRLAPGESVRVMIRNVDFDVSTISYYNTQRKVSIVIKFYSGANFIGTSDPRLFYLGDGHTEYNEDWVVREYDIRH